MKKLILSLWILSFVFGGYYLVENYTFVQLSPDQMSQLGSRTLQSAILSPDTDTTTWGLPSDVLVRIGSFAMVRKSSQLNQSQE